jgi:hypothetical protein
MGYRSANLVGKWAVLPDCAHGHARYLAKLRVPSVPHARTSLEIIKMRYGKYAHWLFILLNLINNVFGCGSMILAGAQLVTGMTGMHVIAACILIPAGGKSVEGQWRMQTLTFVLL